jgi:hypothetical protein
MGSFFSHDRQTRADASGFVKVRKFMILRTNCTVSEVPLTLAYLT